MKTMAAKIIMAIFKYQQGRCTKIKVQYSLTETDKQKPKLEYIYILWRKTESRSIRTLKAFVYH